MLNECFSLLCIIYHYHQLDQLHFLSEGNLTSTGKSDTIKLPFINWNIVSNNCSNVVNILKEVQWQKIVCKMWVCWCERVYSSYVMCSVQYSIHIVFS